MWAENFHKIFKWNIDKSPFFIHCMLLNALLILSNFNAIVKMLTMSFYLSNDPGCCVTNDNVMVNLCNSLGKRIRSFVEREKRWGFVFDNLVPAKWKNYFLLIMSAGAQCIYTCIHVLRVNFLEHRHIDIMADSWYRVVQMLFGK